jgi:subtilase family serine protease
MKRLLILLILVFVFVALKAEAASGPDLVPYKPAGWSAPCVCSTEEGDKIGGDDLEAGATTYVSYAVKNIGNETAHGISLAIFVDGSQVAGYFDLSENLGAGSYLTFDATFTINSPGTHTVRYEVDYYNYVGEINEGNNSFTATYEWVELAPDLIPYKPPGWASPLVCSTVPGDTIGGGNLAIGTPTYAIFAVKNIGNQRSPFLGDYAVMVDGNVVRTVDNSGYLDPGEYCVFPVQKFRVNSVGIHTVTGVVDCKGDVGEINEDNNSFSADYYWPPGPDLVPYTPKGWDAPLICSTVPGDVTADDTLAIDVLTHIRFAVKNFGDETASGISLAIFVDGIQVAGYFDLSENLGAGSYLTFDATFTINSPGTHTVRYEVDYYNYVDEAIESNNSFSVDYYWMSGGDLIPYAPPGWSSPLVLSTEPGDIIGGNDLQAGIPTYVSFAVKNVGNEISPLGDYVITLDGDRVVHEDAYVYLEPGEYHVFSVKNFTVNSPGMYTVAGKVDYDGNVNEINKGNNDFTTKQLWKFCDLVPHALSGWDGAIVASSIPGTHTLDLPPLFGGAATYIDCAVVNAGNLDIPSTDSFYIALYSEEGFLDGWWFNGLDVKDYVYVEDLEHSFSQGKHTLTLFVDSTDNIKEGTSEDNNRYSQDFFWNEPDWGGGGTWYSDSAEYIIITCDSLADAFEPLARWKTKKGVYAKIFTVEDIYANFSGDHTGDNASRIRNFIYEARESGAIYILLGGQCDFEHGEEIVPRRDAFVFDYRMDDRIPDEDTIPCDLYYSDLSGNWDMDFDGTYGEIEDWVDMYTDILVGRAPVKNTQQVENFISKVMTYEKHPDPDYIKKIYLPVGNLMDYDHGTGINDKIADEVPGDWQISKQYEDDIISQEIVNDSMNSGFNLQHWVSHGDEHAVYYNCLPGQEKIAYYSSGDPPNNTNDSTKTSIVSCFACITGGVDLEDDAEYGYDCLAERIVNVNKHAGVATIMNTRFGWGPGENGGLGPSGKISLEFHRKLFNSSAYHLGEAVGLAKNQLINTTLIDKYMRYVLYEWTLFGDPEMPVWTDAPVEMEVTYDEIINIETTIVDINVKEKNSAVPVENAYVCLWKENDVYERDYTNASGDLNLEINPDTVGLMSITVTKENMLPYEGEIVVRDEIFIETGKISVYQSGSSEWHTVDFSNTYTDPIVIMGPPSVHGNQPITVRVKDVNSNGFKFQIDEWDYLDGRHNSVGISYLVMEAGVHSIGGQTWEAGKVENVNHNYTSKAFGNSFGGDQALLTQVVTCNDVSAVCTRVENLTDSGFQVKIQEEEGNDGSHSSETVHYLAISPGTGQIDGKDFVAGKTANSVTDDWYTIDFGQSLDTPLILADMNTENEDDPAALRYRNLSNSSVQVKVEEEQSEDSEVEHNNAEAVGYLVISTVESEPSSFETTGDKVIYENYIRLSSPIITGNLILNVSSNYDRKASVELIDIAGRVIKSKEINLKRGRENLSLGQFISGVYFIRIRSDEDKEYKVHKITVLR